ncbi:LOW QUALITY PROTEIN: chitinase-like protein Idgf5 [Lucilia sericata]|uniref:LOW QUALITY PROTEIN: chitinase-like protein Idgf5 n=1 Tax=Lucilia sericata TaxID=13632 RepID=UPI0018A8499B|nr:LOW QUALITY PROTEIN: chitinase-like protein Idgf5 [Lucilia sericata]
MGTIKIIAIFSVIFLQVLNIQNVKAANMVCYLDTSRVKEVQQTIFDIDPAMQFCNYLIYGYAGINSDTFQLKTLDRGLNFDLYHAVTALKRKHSHLKVLLSVGGDRDLESDEEEPNKYLMLLENIAHRNAFINSAQSFVNTYGFDGLDLAWQFPKNPPKEVHSGIRKAWNKFKGWFKGRKIVDEKAEEHREQFVSFVRELRQSMSSLHALLTMTVLPHVSAELFYDIPQIVPQMDFVTLATFDYVTPLRDPKVADYTASIYELFERDPELNIDHQVQYWLNHTSETTKLVMGIPAYGRSWVMTKESGITGYPPLPAGGAAPAGNLTKTQGLLSWPEVCVKLHNNKELKGEEATLHKVGDPTKRFGTYCYRDADENGDYGLWVSYEEPATAANKANYARVRSLGGVALFDLTTDDVLGTCGDGKYPILRSIKYKL